MKILAFGTNKSNDGFIPTFSFIQLFPHVPKFRDPLVYIGQPGRDDLESTRNRATEYILVEISHGMFRGMVPSAEPAYKATKTDT